MRNMLIATLAAVLVQPLLLLLLTLGFNGFDVRSVEWRIGIAIVVVAGIHVLMLGVPSFLALRASGHAHAWTMAVAGFFAAALPWGGLGLYASWGQLATGRELERFIATMTIWGLFGVVSALTFWYAWLHASGLRHPSRVVPSSEKQKSDFPIDHRI